MPKLCNINNISEKSIPNIMLALKMYDEQVIRQASITTMDNKFKGDYKAKLNLITDNYNQIANYFLDEMPENTIWGQFSNYQKKQLLETIERPDLTYPGIRKAKLINAITLYTTLIEAEEISHGNSISLNRFVTKRSR